MDDHDLYSEAWEILTEVGERIHAPIKSAQLVRMHSNTIFALPSAPVLVRIATNPDAFPRVAVSTKVTRWLSDRGFPCTRPIDISEQPFLIHGRAVSLWHRENLMPAPPATGVDLGRLLRSLHDQPLPPDHLSRLVDPLVGIAKAVTQFPDTMSDEDRAWITGRIAELRDAYTRMDFPHPLGLIHGDAYVGNLMRITSGEAILGDWDHVAQGPPEWDLMQIHYTRRRFGHPSDLDTAGFAREYGWDVREWPGLDTLIAIRELAGLSPYMRTASIKPFSRAELTHRVETLRNGDSTAPWQSPS